MFYINLQMGMLIISCLGSLREMIKRKERRRKRSRKSRRRRRSFSRWFLFSPPSSFPLFCLKNIAGRFDYKKSAKLLQSLIPNWRNCLETLSQKCCPSSLSPPLEGPGWVFRRAGVGVIVSQSTPSTPFHTPF